MTTHFQNEKYTFMYFQMLWNFNVINADYRALTIVAQGNKYELGYPKELDLTIRFASGFTTLHKIVTSLILCFCTWKTNIIMLIFQ